EARRAFKELEDGEPEALQLWQWFREESLTEFNRIYELLGVTFDSYLGEAFYAKKADIAVKLLQEKGILVESDNALVVPLEEYELPPVLIKKSDGATLYATRDLAAVLHRKETYKF